MQRVLASSEKPIWIPEGPRDRRVVGKRYGIDPILLASVAKVESNYDQAARNTNKDGSVDAGVMQIISKFCERYAEYAEIHIENFHFQPESRRKKSDT